MKNRWPIKKNGYSHRSKSVVETTTTIMTTLLIVAAAIIASPLLLLNGLSAQAQTSQGLAGTTFPPPIFSTIRSQPAYQRQLIQELYLEVVDHSYINLISLEDMYTFTNSTLRYVE
jgi:hypothetical protein